MFPVSGTSPIAALDAGRLSELAREVERRVPGDPVGAMERLATLRVLVTAIPEPLAGEAARLGRILDQLDADLRTGAVRSITGLSRQVRQLEAAATFATIRN